MINPKILFILAGLAAAWLWDKHESKQKAANDRAKAPIIPANDRANDRERKLGIRERNSLQTDKNTNNNKADDLNASLEIAPAAADSDGDQAGDQAAEIKPSAEIIEPDGTDDQTTEDPNKQAPPPVGDE